MHPEKRWFRSLWLDWRQRRPRRRPFFLFEKLGQLRDSCRSKKGGYRETLAEYVLNLRDDLHGKERVATDIKEIIIDPDRCKPENMSPDLYHFLFQWCPRHVNASGGRTRCLRRPREA